MIEKMRAVSNPLTIIAIFAALAEVAGTIVLALVDQSIQGIFVWFVMLFPAANVLLFFLTLNFNPRVLYAPSDFKDERHFLQTIGAKIIAKEITTKLMTIADKLHAAHLVISAETSSKQDSAATKEALERSAAMSDLVQNIQETIDSLLQTSEEINRITSEALPSGGLSQREEQVWKLISDGGTVRTIAAELGLNPEIVEVYRAGLLEKTGTQNNAQLTKLYKKSPKPPDSTT